MILDGNSKSVNMIIAENQWEQAPMTEMLTQQCEDIIKKHDDIVSCFNCRFKKSEKERRGSLGFWWVK